MNQEMTDQERARQMDEQYERRRSMLNGLQCLMDEAQEMESDVEFQAWMDMVGAVGALIVRDRVAATPQLTSSVEITQGARDDRPRFGNLKLYFEYGTDAGEIAAYAERIIDEVHEMLEERGIQ